MRSCAAFAKPPLEAFYSDGKVNWGDFRAKGAGDGQVNDDLPLVRRTSVNAGGRIDVVLPRTWPTKIGPALSIYFSKFKSLKTVQGSFSHGRHNSLPNKKELEGCVQASPPSTQLSRSASFCILQLGFTRFSFTIPAWSAAFFIAGHSEWLLPLRRCCRASGTP